MGLYTLVLFLMTLTFSRSQESEKSYLNDELLKTMFDSAVILCRMNTYDKTMTKKQKQKSFSGLDCAQGETIGHVEKN